MAKKALGPKNAKLQLISSNSSSISGYYMEGSFLSATGGFFVVGVIAVVLVFVPMQKEFEEIRKRQKKPAFLER